MVSQKRVRNTFGPKKQRTKITEQELSRGDRL